MMEDETMNNTNFSNANILLLNNSLVSRLRATSNLLAQQRYNTVHNVFVNGETGIYPIANDRLCFLNNALISDFLHITFSLMSMPDINQFDLRPLYCVLRSAIEKYADITNHFSCGDNYYQYLDYLDNYSDYIYHCIRREFTQQEKKNVEEKLEKEETHIEGLLGVEKCNRSTRYYLLGRFNFLYKSDGTGRVVGENAERIIEFNKELAKLDSSFSQILHNNVETNPRSNKEKVAEIYRAIVYATYAAQRQFETYYITDLQTKVNQCHNCDLHFENFISSCGDSVSDLLDYNDINDNTMYRITF